MKFLKGTYGFDLLSIFLLLLGSLLNLSFYTRILGFLLLIIVIFRAFSKNIYKRTCEFQKFIAIVNKILSKFGKKLPTYLPNISLETFPLLFKYYKENLAKKRRFKIVKCPKCKQKLRLPRGKGKIIVTCKKCGHEFHMKS